MTHDQPKANPEATSEAVVTPPRLGLASVVLVVALLAGPGLAGVAAWSGRATPAQAMAAGGVTLVTGLIGPALWLALPRVRLSGFMGLTLGLSLTRTIVAVLVGAAVAWLAGPRTAVGGEGFWTLLLLGAGALFIAEKAISVVAAWPVLGLSAGGLSAAGLSAGGGSSLGRAGEERTA